VPRAASAISAASDRVFESLMRDADAPIYLAKLTVERELLAPHAPDITWDLPRLTVLRSVLMKPEHLALVDVLHATVERHAGRVLSTEY
jgi:hypothetical protein